MSADKNSSVSLPEMSEDEQAKWTRYFTRLARRGNRKTDEDDAEAGVNESTNDNNNNAQDDDGDDDQQQQEQQQQQADGEQDAGGEAPPNSAGGPRPKPRKLEKQPKEKKAQSDFRQLQLSLATAEGVATSLQDGLFGEDKTSPLFAQHKNLGVFFQALLSIPGSNSRKAANKKNKKGGAGAAAAEEEEDHEDDPDQQSRSLVVRQVIKACKPHVWTLLSLLNSWPKTVPLTSPCLKFIALCDIHGVATDKWAATVEAPTTASKQPWTQPALPPKALLRALEMRAWFEFLCGWVEVAESDKEIIKLCFRLQTSLEAAQKLRMGEGNKKKDDDDDEELTMDPDEEEDGTAMMTLPANKMSLLASKFASKLLRWKQRLFLADGLTQSAKRNTLAYAADALNALTLSLPPLTTLKKVTHACTMLTELLPVAAAEDKGDDDDGEEDDDDAKFVRDYRTLLDKVGHRCAGGSSEEEVAMAAARQLTAVAKFKGAQSAKELSDALDEIVDPEYPDALAVKGDDVISSLAVAVNTLLGPQQSGAPRTAVRFLDEAALEDELEAEMAGMLGGDTSADAEAKKEEKKKNINAPVVSEELSALQRRVMGLLEKEILAGKRLPRRAQAFLDRCRQETRRRQRNIE